MIRDALLLAVSILIGAAEATADAQIDRSLPTHEISPIRYNKSKVFFAEGTDELSPLGRSTLNHQAAVMKGVPTANFVIVGHTDPHETGSKDASLGLGYRRALAVRDYLVSRGVHPHRLRLESRGYEGVIVLNESDSSMAGLRYVGTEFLRDDR